MNLQHPGLGLIFGQRGQRSRSQGSKKCRNALYSYRLLCRRTVTTLNGATSGECRYHNAASYATYWTLALFTSHTRTVVRECCKGDDASQWENEKFDPLPRPNPLTDRHKKLHT